MDRTVQCLSKQFDFDEQWPLQQYFNLYRPKLGCTICAILTRFFTPRISDFSDPVTGFGRDDTLLTMTSSHSQEL